MTTQPTTDTASTPTLRDRVAVLSPPVNREQPYRYRVAYSFKDRTGEGTGYMDVILNLPIRSTHDTDVLTKMVMEANDFHSVMIIGWSEFFTPRSWREAVA